GVKVDLQIIADYSTLTQMWGSRDQDQRAKWDIIVSTLTMQPQPARRVWGIFGPDNLISQYDNLQMNALLEDQLADVNNESRAKKREEVQRFVMDECAVGPMGYQFSSIGGRKELKGVKITPLEGGDLRDVWLEKS